MFRSNWDDLKPVVLSTWIREQRQVEHLKNIWTTVNHGEFGVTILVALADYHYLAGGASSNFSTGANIHPGLIFCWVTVIGNCIRPPVDRTVINDVFPSISRCPTFFLSIWGLQQKPVSARVASCTGPLDLLKGQFYKKPLYSMEKPLFPVTLQ